MERTVTSPLSIKLTLQKRTKSKSTDPTWLRPVSQSRCFPPPNKKDGKREKRRRACGNGRKRGVLAHAHRDLFFSSLAADVTGSSTPCRSLRITQSNTCSRRRSESSALRGQIARPLFAFPAPCAFLFVFLPRNELSGGTPPPAQTRHARTHFSTSIQADTHALSLSHTQHTPAAALRAPPLSPPPLLLLILPSAAAAAGRRGRKKPQW